LGQRFCHSVSAISLQFNDLGYAARDENQMAFFVKLTSELKKVAEFYTEIEAQLASKYLSLMSMFREFVLKAEHGPVSPPQTAEHSRLHLMSQIVQFYMLLLQLENFAVMNLCGFGKILKKHDKLTG
jgi:SPX domain protein involved in polyphosphate accumulation